MTTSTTAREPKGLPLESLELEILAAHPMSQQLAFLARRRYLFLTPCAFLGLFVGLAAIEGRFLQPNALEVVCGDLRALLDAPNALCKVEDHSSVLNAQRDVLGVLVVTLFPLTLPLWIRQWRAISAFLPAMAERGILAITQESVVRSEVAACNVYFHRLARLNWVVAGGAVLCMVLVARIEAIGPAYPILSDAAGNPGLPSTDWWLSLRGSFLPSVAYFIVGVLAIYAVLIQNVHGSRVVLLIWRLRRSVKYGADLDNADGFYGWSEVSQILFATWTLTIVHAVCLTAVSLSLPQGALYAVWPLLGQWLVVTPFYLTVPIWLTRRNIRSWRTAQLALIASTDVVRSPMHQRLAALKARKIRAVKVNPYAGSLKLVSAFLGNIGSIVLVIQVLRYIYT